MKRKNAEEFVKIIQLLMSSDEENWILGITLFSETSFYKNLNKHAIFYLPCVYEKLGVVTAPWSYRGYSFEICLKSHVQDLLKVPPEQTYGRPPQSVGILGNILFKLLRGDYNVRTKNNVIINNEFYRYSPDNTCSDVTKHNRNFRRKKNRRYDRELDYYERALNSNIQLL